MKRWECPGENKVKITACFVRKCSEEKLICLLISDKQFLSKVFYFRKEVTQKWTKF